MKWYYDPDTFKRIYLAKAEIPPSNYQPGMGPKQIRSHWYWRPQTGEESQITDLSKIPNGWINGRNKNRLSPKFLAK